MEYVIVKGNIICNLKKENDPEVLIAEVRNQGRFQAREDHQCHHIEEAEYLQMGRKFRLLYHSLKDFI